MSSHSLRITSGSAAKLSGGQVAIFDIFVCFRFDTFVLLVAKNAKIEAQRVINEGTCVTDNKKMGREDDSSNNNNFEDSENAENEHRT
jgi:hypothetical protein